MGASGEPEPENPRLPAVALPPEPEPENLPLPAAPPVSAAALLPESRRWPWSRDSVLGPVLILSLPLMFCCLTSPLSLFLAVAGDPVTPCDRACMDQLTAEKTAAFDAGLLAVGGSLVALAVAWSPRVPTAVRIAALICGLVAAAPFPYLYFR
ncbi:hypothetical protein [Rugosimonospora africana]|uniref:Uncharacterized protein n=1 Tax=Rugosimonospora africana TaxID=556532 RepID=A0A8J3QR62_9ACTN|nr:hypothetical protein [Rugosimonospora africana]GIH15404.1 hypothetical protein Raf01_35760 [Rugosimonospora africana]